MKILRNYILRDFFGAFTFSMLAITFILLLGNLIKLSDMVIRKGISIIGAAKMFMFLMPYLLGFILPLSILLGILISLGRIIADNEIVAIHVAGISLTRILGIFLILGVIFSLFLFILTDKVSPHFHHAYSTQKKKLCIKNISALIEPGVLLDNFEGFILRVEQVQGNKLKNIHIFQLDEEKLKQKIFAKQGFFTADENILKIKLEDGFSSEISTETGKEIYRVHFKVFFRDIPVKKEKAASLKKKPKDLSVKELQEKIRHLKSLGIPFNDPAQKDFLLEFYKRISFSFSPLIFVLLGFGTATIVRHREKSINLGIAAILASSYYLLLLLGEALVKTNVLMPVIGMWLPNAIFLFLGIFLINRNVYFR